MKKYASFQMEVLKLDVEDAIRTSGLTNVGPGGEVGEGSGDSWGNIVG